MQPLHSQVSNITCVFPFSWLNYCLSHSRTWMCSTRLWHWLCENYLRCCVFFSLAPLEMNTHTCTIMMYGVGPKRTCRNKLFRDTELVDMILVAIQCKCMGPHDFEKCDLWWHSEFIHIRTNATHRGGLWPVWIFEQFKYMNSIAIDCLSVCLSVGLSWISRFKRSLKKTTEPTEPTVWEPHILESV